MAKYKAPPMLPNVHLNPNHRYACMDREPVTPTRYTMQDGWTDDGRRAIVDWETQWLELEDKCGHSYRKSDPACTGCKWR